MNLRRTATVLVENRVADDAEKSSIFGGESVMNRSLRGGFATTPFYRRLAVAVALLHNHHMHQTLEG